MATITTEATTIRAITDDGAYQVSFTSRFGVSLDLIEDLTTGRLVRRECEMAAIMSPAIRALVDELPAPFAAYLAKRIAEADAEQAVADRMAARLAEAESVGTPVFLRWGKAPKGGYSYNHREGQREAGVSVYRAWRISETHYIVDWRTIDTVSAYTVAHGGRDAYILTGEVVGTGGDGEPLLTNIRQRRMHADAEIEVIA